MDTGIIFALVLATLFIGCIVWLVIYSRKQEQKNTQTSAEPPETPSKKRAA